MPTHFKCTQMLGFDGIARRGQFNLKPDGWEIYEPGSEIISLDTSAYIVPWLPVDFHRHAIGGIDLSNLRSLDLHAVDRSLAQEQLAGVLTIFLMRHDLAAFCSLAHDFHQYKQCGDLAHILGLALEGPLLSSPGGTPRECVWNPTSAEWESLVACGELGLQYIVLSPDADTAPAPSMEWIIELLLDGGISPALGHFRKND